MIITQTPLRIGLLGGGTDLPSYYLEHGGRVLNCAIDKYIYVIVKQRFDNDIYVNYSKKEIVSRVEDLEHELVREAMWMTGVTNGVEITRSLGYTTIIALAAPVGPLIGFFVGDRVERKWVIVGSAGLILICGLIFGATTFGPLIVLMGLALQIANNAMSYSFHAYQQELFPTGLRARAAGFVYSWSRLSVIFSSFIIAFLGGLTPSRCGRERLQETPG